MCLICGGKFVKRRRGGEACENVEDGRHKQPRPRPPKIKVRPLTEAQKKVKLEVPPNAT